MELQARLTAHVDAQQQALIGLSHAVHADAEVGFEEHTSSRRVAEALDSGGFAVQHGVAGLETAVSATFGSGPLRIGICAEYDALPGIGHACGHNIIAAAAVGAGLALAEIADDVGLSVRVLGTPAEEDGGGKIVMMDGGAFDGLHAAMMVHPAPYEAATLPCLARRHFDVHYTGRPAHASAFPEKGVNAADALTVAQVAVGLLRQHIRSDERIHGIVTHGGDAANTVPERTSGQWYARAGTLEALAELYPRVQRCFEAGALATGAQVDFGEPTPAYSEFLPDDDLMGTWINEAATLGRKVTNHTMAGSTDMANVSLVMPSIHPMIAIDADGAGNHQPAFAAACVNASADLAVRDGALGMARTAVMAAMPGPVRDRLLARVYRSGGGDTKA